MSAENQTARRGARLPAHLPALDGVRGIAILLVLVHMLGTFDGPRSVLGFALSFVLVRGWAGVQLFFVLSGFLITGILLDTQSAENGLSAFFARRLLRILPLYYLVLLVAFVVLPVLGPLPPTLAHDRAHQIWFWTYLSNWTLPYEAGARAFPHFWSLAVEEQFYLVWPFVVRSRSPASCVKVCLGVAAASLAIRIAFLVGHVTPGAIYSFSVTRMDALALGGAAAAALRVPALSERLLEDRRRLWLASFGIAMVGAVVTKGYALRTVAGDTVGYTFLAVAFAFGVLAAAASDVTPAAPLPLLRARPLRALGKYSYAMYVLHKPLHDFVGLPLASRLGLDVTHSLGLASGYLACGLAATFAVAFVSYHAFERHFLRLKTLFVPRARASSLALTAQSTDG